MMSETPKPTPEPMPLRKAMERAFHLGQTYWQQADHHFLSQQRKAKATRQGFREFADATCAQYDSALTAERAEAEWDALRARVAELEAIAAMLGAVVQGAQEEFVRVPYGASHEDVAQINEWHKMAQEARAALAALERGDGKETEHG